MSELIEHEKTEVVATQKINEVGTLQDRLLENAIAQGASIEYIDKLLELKIKYDNEEARKSFARDLARFKEVDLQIVKDLVNSQYNSSYSSIGNIVTKVTREMSKFGFTTRWDFKDEPDLVYVSCFLTHKDGHFEFVELNGLPDKSGAKNKLQERKSTRTYLKIETFEAVTGISSQFCNIDDDAKSLSDCFISGKKLNEIKSLIESTKSDETLFLKFAKVDNLDSILDKNADRMINALKDKVKS